MVRSEENGGRSASDLISLAMEEFERRVRPFARAVLSLGNLAERYTVLAILAEEVPGIELSHSFLQLIADLGGTFQVDIGT